MPMIPKEREQKIINLINDNNGCTVTELADMVNVSETTIRRDLQTLTEQNLIDRTHGGALPKVNRGRPYDNRKIHNLEQKEAIGQRAAEEVHSGQIVLFDSGSTPIEVAKSIPKNLSFVSITPMPSIARELARGECEIHTTGGTYCRDNHTCVGPWAEKNIKQTNFDLLILGTDGIDEDGLSARDLQQYHLKELMIKNSERVILVGDHSKFEDIHPFKFADYSDIDLFITDKTVPDRLRESFESANVDLIEKTYS